MASERRSATPWLCVEDDLGNVAARCATQCQECKNIAESEETGVSPQEAVKRAIELLREWAEITRKGHTNPPAFIDWGDELHAKACHDEYLSIANAIECAH